MSLDYRTTVAAAAKDNLPVSYALAAIARHPSYVFGATGPDAYDCSGLTMKALEQVSVELPHNAGLQVAWFREHGVLLPGDTPANRHRLIPGRSVAFYYGDVAHPESVGHCALYLGRSRTLRLWIVAAAVDPAYGVIRHRMNRFLRPCGFGIALPYRSTR